MLAIPDLAQDVPGYLLGYVDPGEAHRNLERLTAVEAGIHFGFVGTLQILFGETSGSTSALRDVFASEFDMDAAEPAAQLFM